VGNIDALAIPGFREPFSCLTHFLGAVVFAILGVYLVKKGGGNWGRTVALAAMAATSVFLLLMSAGYHMLAPGAARHVLRQLDIAGVFALIAGSATPVHVILFRGFHRWAPIVLVWMAALVGILMRVIYADAVPWHLEATGFLVMGWGGSISAVKLWRQFGFSFIEPLVWGGVSYTVGVLLLTLRWPVIWPGVIGSHELWHIAVLMGLGLHWSFVFQFASGSPRSTPSNSTWKGKKNLRDEQAPRFSDNACRDMNA
jgi:channel protein (hemolysin III family)